LFTGFAHLAAVYSSKQDACLEKQKEEYRTSNPKASYAQVQRKYAEFKMMCSRLKGK
jgi:hypothetical protein